MDLRNRPKPDSGWLSTALVRGSVLGCSWIFGAGLAGRGPVLAQHYGSPCWPERCEVDLLAMGAEGAGMELSAGERFFDKLLDSRLVVLDILEFSRTLEIRDCVVTW